MPTGRWVTLFFNFIMAPVQLRSMKAHDVAEEKGYGNNPFIYFDHELFTQRPSSMKEKHCYFRRIKYLAERSISGTEGNLGRADYLNGNSDQIKEAEVFIETLKDWVAHQMPLAEWFGCPWTIDEVCPA